MKFAAILLAAFLSGLGVAQAKKVEVLGVPADAPLIEPSRCVAPYLCHPRGDRSVFTYNPDVWGNPKFSAGSVTLRNGGVLSGEVALLQTQQDWEFVKHHILVIPAGEAQAIYAGPGDALLVTQQTKKSLDTYDLYGDIYLKRLVSGRLRLSFNPTAGTSRPIADFLPPGLMEDAQRQLAAEEVLAAIRDGKNLRDVRDSGTASQALADVVSSIEITEKEYLLYDEAAETTTLITKANHRQIVEGLFAACPAADPGQAKSFSRSYRKITDAFEYLNAVCFE